ncbi:MAG: hypothetical protein J6B41_08410, partial [Alistipes sp.]|nr:hypothetical protein [Alistipes sp.]
ISEAVFWQGFRRDENRSILGVCEDFHHKSNADKTRLLQSHKKKRDWHQYQSLKTQELYNKWDFKACETRKTAVYLA